MEFLLNQGFSIDTMCNTGVRYLSREEEELAIQIAVEKSRCRTPIPDMKIQEDDRECLEFLQSSRLTINSWLAEGAVSIPQMKLDQVMQLTLAETPRVAEYPTTYRCPISSPRDSLGTKQYTEAARASTCQHRVSRSDIPGCIDICSDPESEPRR